MQTSGDAIKVQLDDRGASSRVAWVTVCNEQRRNSLTSAMTAELTAVFTRLADDPALRAVVLRGEGAKAFIGGADIREMAELEPVTARAFIERLHGLCQAIRDLPVPVIARLQGYTLGAGLEIAASCDLRIAARSARLGMPEVRLGIPSVIEAALLPRLVGWGWTRRLVLLGEIITAQEAWAVGLVERLTSDAQLDAGVEDWLAMLLAAPPGAIRAQKQLIAQWEDAAIAQAIEHGIAAFARSYETGEPTATMRAYLDERRQRPRPAKRRQRRST